MCTMRSLKNTYKSDATVSNRQINKQIDPTGLLALRFSKRKVLIIIIANHQERRNKINFDLYSCFAARFGTKECLAVNTNVMSQTHPPASTRDFSPAASQCKTALKKKALLRSSLLLHIHYFYNIPIKISRF